MSRRYAWRRDPVFWIAVLGAPLFWAALLIATAQSPVWSWPFAEPLRFLMPALVYPVLEEIVFRGLVQEQMQRLLRGRMLGPLSGANITTSVVFTALHFLYHAPAWAAAVLIPSLLFGYFKDKSGHLAIPIALHVFYNSGYYWLFGGGAT